MQANREAATAGYLQNRQRRSSHSTTHSSGERHRFAATHADLYQARSAAQVPQVRCRDWTAPWGSRNAAFFRGFSVCVSGSSFRNRDWAQYRRGASGCRGQRCLHANAAAISRKDAMGCRRSAAATSRQVGRAGQPPDIPAGVARSAHPRQGARQSHSDAAGIHADIRRASLHKLTARPRGGRNKFAVRWTGTIECGARRRRVGGSGPGCRNRCLCLS